MRTGRRLALWSAVAVGASSLTVLVEAPATVAALPGECQQAGATVSCTYIYTGAEQTFTVPSGVTSVSVTAVGGAGGDSYGDAVPGRGASVTGDLSVSGIDTLYVEVGGSGGNGEGFNGRGGFNGGGGGYYGGGGGGGGASDVRSQSSAASDTLSSRLLVAAGANGAGSLNWTTANGSATAPSDYTAASGTLTIPAGTRTGRTTVQVNGDRTREPSEVFFVLLSHPTGARITDPTASGGIISDD